ncbi:RNA-binding protein Musashi [Klebsormidium nitens]|uniref:RNA-binding protein Musashi n=1 Tax=Klebsormidium nitens TaxID=105231 RepID=A0A1Y1IGN6_KLENI|nr:RNA-binding protein Musashi [Klebsormidium nitens]|eukprot:GAQ90030.1 RNA-binding protein Musashi [Klebsormidium nitens]
MAGDHDVLMVAEEAGEGAPGASPGRPSARASPTSRHKYLVVQARSMADEQQINGNQDEGLEYQQEEQAGQNGGERQEENIESHSQAQTAAASDGGQAGIDQGKIFVGGLSWDTSTEGLRNHFAKYGNITDAVIMKDRITGRPRGFGFVTFDNQDSVNRVLEEKHRIDGRDVEVKSAVPREASQGLRGPRTKKIFVGGLPASATEDVLKEHFGAYGTIVDVVIMQDHTTGRSRGFGFLTFDNEAVVDTILSSNKVHEIDNKQVEVKKAEPKKPLGDGPTGGYGGGGYGGGYGGRSGGYGGGGYGGGYGDGYGGGYGAGAGGGYGRSTGGRGGYGSAGYGGPAGYGAGYGGSGYGGYGSSSGGYGGSSAGGGYGSSGYAAGGYGYGSGYGAEDVYGASAGYGGYGAAGGASAYGSGYGAGSSGGGYGSSGYGSSRGGMSGAGGSGGSRYHPYGRG